MYLSTEVGKAASPNESAPRRNYRAAKEAWTHPPGKPNVTTVYELLLEGIKEFGPNAAMGQRRLIKVHTETKQISKVVNGEETKVDKQWQYYEMSPYNFITFNELGQVVKDLGSGLIALGLKPKQDRVHLYSRTCCEWMQMFLATQSQNMTVVTAYDTLGKSGLSSSIEESETVAILSDADNLHLLAETLGETPTIKFVIYRDYDGELTSEQVKAKHEIEKIRDIKVLPFSRLVELGKKNPAEPHPPTPDDISCIMYTSGSTGKPKGVILLQKTVVAGVTGAVGNVGRDTVTPKDVFLNILPLAHIFELTAELAFLYWGCRLGYGTPKTITDVNMRNCRGDIVELRPTVMAAVPAVYEQVKKGILAKIKQASPFAQKLFWRAYKLKQRLQAWGLPVPLIDNLIFKKIKEATGGRLRVIMNGGSALSYETRTFLSTVLAPLLMGYGLTETNAMCTISTLQHVDLDSSGELVPCVTVKLVDVPDAGYHARNGEGEILIKGGSVSPGYFKNDELTKESFTEDGYFKTGDIGEWTNTGALRIIDRRKNLVKTLNGEYIALERLESVYRSNEFVQNICVFADDQHVKPVAVIVLNPAAAEHLCQEKGVQYHDPETVAENPELYKAILKSIQDTGRKAGLKSVEIFAGIAISEEEWTPQNGFVTSAQKVQRKKIKEANLDGLTKAFADA